MNSTSLSAVFTDLDGTLLNSARKVSEANLACLQLLGQQETVRVIATGRSWYSFRQVIASDFPADFLIFSSGAGIVDLRNGKLLKKASLSAPEIGDITASLESQKADFMVHHPIPENHRFTYRRNSSNNTDFNRRIDLYKEFACNVESTGNYPKEATQVIAILTDNPDRFTALKSTLNGFQITRATSPLDHSSIWLEIYPQNVHKGSAASWLCQHLQIDPNTTIGIGNDYNDIELLEFTSRSYMLANGPRELHAHYLNSSSNDENGFSNSVRHALANT
ncbi:HAD-IIB family hydrolase [Desulfosediminicola flagellatus]|uniref:HAD-IIB family hydrolase n=1 Tax=Desulfosediminicola flagellatus TaxID=2569541 RepID=UPI0010AC48EB|nr:HAD-IIB family hydrolase [Desulfosediminicola flagellatus]